MKIKTKKVNTLPPSTNWLRRAKLFLLLLAGISITWISCKKETDVIGVDVQPPNDLIGVEFQDTTTLITKTISADSLRTDETLIVAGDVLIGSYIDPVFGRTDASLYTQLRLTTFNPSFGTGTPQVDSVVLSIAYNPKYYGRNYKAPQTIKVHKLTQAFASDSAYFSNASMSKDPIDLANGYTFTPRPSDSVLVGGTKQKPQLRIPLDNSFGQALLTQPTSYYANNATFLTYLNGIHITTESTPLANTEGNILYFKAGDSYSKLTVYYNDSLSYDFALSNVERFNHFAHTYTSADMDLQAQLGTTPPAQNQTVFVQSMAGLKAKIEMPYLTNWPNKERIVINKAELVIKVNTSTIYQLDSFAAPEKLVLIGISDTGTDYILPDAGSNERPGYYGGSLDTVNYEYRINIGRYVQQVLSGAKPNNGLHLVASSAQINGNRVVIGGGAPGSPYQMKLNIAYTKLP